MAITNGYCTLAEVRASAKFPASDTADDGLLERAVESASRRVDGYCGRFFYQTSSVAVKCYPFDDYNLPTDDIPTTTVTLKTDDNGDGTFETTWTQGVDYQLEPLNAQVYYRPYRRIVAIGGKTFPQAFLPNKPLVEVTTTWGWASIPTDIREATVILALRIYQRPSSALGVAGFNDTGAVMVRSVDPDVREMLTPYRIPGLA